MSTDFIEKAPPQGKPIADEQLWFTRCPVPTASGLAADRGWLDSEFSADGLSFRSLQDSDHDLVDRHFDHHLRGLFREGGNVPALWARSLGPHTRLIGITWVDEYQGILVRADSGIAEPADLAGARVAIPREDVPWSDFRQAMAVRGFTSALGLAGLTLADARATTVRSTVINRPVGVPGKSAGDRTTAGDELAALAAGDVDAIYVKGAVGHRIAQRPELAELVDLGSHPDRSVRINNGTPRTVTVHQSLLHERPDIVSRYMGSLLDAAAWARSHVAELRETFVTETGAHPDSVARGYDAHGLRPRLTPDWIDALTEQKDFLLATGFLERDFDVAAWAAPEPLAAAIRARANH